MCLRVYGIYYQKPDPSFEELQDYCIEIAQKDIKVFKALHVRNGIFTSPYFYTTQWTPGETKTVDKFTGKIKRCRFVDNIISYDIDIDEGIHCYSFNNEMVNEGVNALFSRAPELKIYEGRIKLYKMIIPKGTKYIRSNFSGEIVTQALYFKS